MVSNGEIDSINVAHKGDIVGEVIEGSHRLVAQTQNSLGKRVGSLIHIPG
jgi:hypothetical protein